MAAPLFSILNLETEMKTVRLFVQEVMTRDARPKELENVMTRDPMNHDELNYVTRGRYLVQRYPAATKDAGMPEADDEQFDAKLEAHFRKECRAVLAMTPEELEGRNVFKELKDLLARREEVINAHDKYLGAQKEIERHTATGAYSRDRAPTKVREFGKVTTVAELSERNKRFWSGRS
jgi:hypothetical protein